MSTPIEFCGHVPRSESSHAFKAPSFICRQCLQQVQTYAELERLSIRYDEVIIKEQERTIERIRKVVNQEGWKEPFARILLGAQDDLTRMLMDCSAVLAYKREELEHELRVAQ